MDRPQGSGSQRTVPTVGVIAGIVGLLLLPFAWAAIPADTGLLRWVVWVTAGLILIYVVAMLRKITREQGIRAALKWLFTGKLPPRSAEN